MPPTVKAKTAQKHDYPSMQHRRSYARRAANGLPPKRRRRRRRSAADLIGAANAPP